METFSTTIVKLIGAVAQLSVAVNQFQATLAMMTKKMITTGIVIEVKVKK